MKRPNLKPFRNVSGVLLAGWMAAAPGTLSAADAAAGQALAERWCNACHSIGTDEPRMADLGPLFVELSKKDNAYLTHAINRPHELMPDYPSLTDAMKADLVAYILSLRES